jgi:Bacterial antitoxin of type II TA system, VapB
MLICMRTTLDLEDAVIERARRRAVKEGTTLTDIVERALRLFLMRRADAPAPLAERWVVIRGEREPAVEIADRDRLLDLLGDRPL